MSSRLLTWLRRVGFDNIQKLIIYSIERHGSVKTTLDMYFRQLWVDPRLEYVSNTTLDAEKIIGDEVCAKTIILTATTLAKIGLKSWLHSTLLHSVFYATRASVYVSLHLAVIVILNVNLFISQLLANITAPSHKDGKIQMRRLEREDSSKSSNPLLKTSTRLPWTRRVEEILKILKASTHLPWARRVEKILGWSPNPLFLLAQIGFWISVGSLSPCNWRSD